MPATVMHEPPGISCVFSDGTSATFGLEGVPCPDLVRDLLAGLVELVHPHGTVDAAGTVSHFMAAARSMARTLSQQGFTGGARQLRRAQVAQFWMATTSPWEACTRRMLLAFHTNTAGLDPKVAELAAGRLYNPPRKFRPLPPYSETEWRHLTTVCQNMTNDAYQAHRQALKAAATGQHPSHGWTGENLRWMLTRVGPVNSSAFAQLLGCPQKKVYQHPEFYQAHADLFPQLDIVVAYRLLFGIYSGIVPDGIDDLTVDDIDWAGDASILLSYVKKRTAAESLTLSRRAVRLLEQWLSHSSLLRGFTDTHEARQLWMGVSRTGWDSVFAGPPLRVAVQRWVARHRLTADDGQPLKIHRSRVRTTHQSMRDKGSWAGRGRVTIDPNHSAQVEGDHYLSATTPSQRQAIDAIVEDAQHDLLRRAQPPTILTDQDTAALARDYPSLIAQLRLDDEVVAELVGGQRDVFTAACADQLSGLHGPKGAPCPARPWVCLLCPLAVFAPRHAANLLRLRAFFTRQWQSMPAAQFMAVFGPYSQRITQILDRFDPALLASAAAHVTGNDNDLPLRPEETTA